MSLRDLFRRSDQGETIRVLDVEASRAVFQGDEVQARIDLRLKVDDGQKLTLDLSVDQAHKMAIQLQTAHDAIIPPPLGRRLS